MGNIKKDHELVERQAEGKPLVNTAKHEAQPSGFIDRMKIELEEPCGPIAGSSIFA